MRTHYLKIEGKYLERILDGSKMFEIRKNDRDYQTGDQICFTKIELNPTKNERFIEFTDKFYFYKITYVCQYPNGLKDGYVVLGIQHQSTQSGKGD